MQQRWRDVKTCSDQNLGVMWSNLQQQPSVATCSGQNSGVMWSNQQEQPSIATCPGLKIVLEGFFSRCDIWAEVWTHVCWWDTSGPAFLLLTRWLCAILASCTLLCDEAKSSWCGGGTSLPVKPKLNIKPQRRLAGSAWVLGVVGLLYWKLCKRQKRCGSGWRCDRSRLSCHVRDLIHQPHLLKYSRSVELNPQPPQAAVVLNITGHLSFCSSLMHYGLKNTWTTWTNFFSQYVLIKKNASCCKITGPSNQHKWSVKDRVWLPRQQKNEVLKAIVQLGGSSYDLCEEIVQCVMGESGGSANVCRREILSGGHNQVRRWSTNDLQICCGCPGS